MDPVRAPSRFWMLSGRAQTSKIKAGLVAAIVAASTPCAAGPLMSVADYQDFSRKGGQSEQVIDIYVGAAIEAIGFVNEAVIERKQAPFFCQGSTTITVRLVRGKIDRFVA